jgi:5-methylcytosine-specific restriction endonuclease McrA
MTEQLESNKALYQEGLEDPRWKRLRINVLIRDKQRCKICGAHENLQIHHRQYHRNKLTGEWSHPWEYHPFFLLTVCSSCHSKGHQKFSIPIKDI